MVTRSLQWIFRRLRQSCRHDKGLTQRPLACQCSYLWWIKQVAGQHQTSLITSYVPQTQVSVALTCRSTLSVNVTVGLVIYIRFVCEGRVLGLTPGASGKDSFSTTQVIPVKPRATRMTTCDTNILQTISYHCNSVSTRPRVHI